MKFQAAAITTLAASASATTFSVCAGSTDNLGVSSVNFSEDPLVPGTTLTITVEGTPTVDITSGATVDFVVKLGAFPVFSASKDACADLGLTCPLPAGVPVEATIEVDVSPTAPSIAGVTAEVSITNGDGSSVSCIDVPISVGTPLLGMDNVEITEELSGAFFAEFKRKFERVYESVEEEAERFGHFKTSLKRVQERNKGLEEPTFGITKFSDLSKEEFASKWLNYKSQQAHDDVSRTNTPTVATSRQLRGAATPSSWDWRDHKGVTAVKDQGQCGSCWAFSTAEAIESAYMIAGNSPTELSIAQIVQCDSSGDDQGCNGGDTITAYDYVKAAGGLSSEADYPYAGAISKGVTGKCDASAEKKVVSGTNVKSWSYATPACTSRKCDNQDEAKLADTLSSVAPPSICVNAEPWQDYTKGVMKASSCDGGYYELDHCVQLIGYDSIDGKDGYWTVRNSWATDWGVDGMIHLEYGSNTCGLADEATVLVLG